MAAAPRKRNPPPDYKPAPPPKARTPGWMWIVIGILLSMVGTLGYHSWSGVHQGNIIGFISSTTAPFTNPKIPSTNESIVAKEPEVNGSSTKNELPREKILKSRPTLDGTSNTSFEFYKLLPDMKVGVPESPESKDSPKNPTKDSAKDSAKNPTKELAKKSSSTMAYMLQAGAFRTPQEAERLRALLAFMGLQSTIRIVGVGTAEVWHKVRLGPFSDFHQATQVQQRLRQEGISAILSKERS